MRGILIITLLLAGCSLPDAPGVAECEEYVLGKIATPASYKRARAGRYEKDGVLHVIVDYDAQNLYGAVVRETQLCDFPLVDGKPSLDEYIDHDGALERRVQEEVDNLELNATGQ